MTQKNPDESLEELLAREDRRNRELWAVIPKHKREAGWRSGVDFDKGEPENPFSLMSKMRSGTILDSDK